MNITINIASIGYNKGTVGWLKSHLESGEIVFEEGITKNTNNHGLWLKYGNQQMFLAAHNLWNDGKYCVVDREEYDNIFGLTPACNSIVNTVALEWCDHHNDIRENDEIMNVTVSLEAA